MRVVCSVESPQEFQADVYAVLCDEETLKTDPLLLRYKQSLGTVWDQAFADRPFHGKKGQTLLFHTQGKLPARRLLLIGVGSFAKQDASQWHLWASRVVRTVQTVNAKQVAWVLPTTTSAPLVQAVQWITEALHLATYVFDAYKRKEKNAPVPPEQVSLLVASHAALPALQAAVQRAEHIVAAVKQVRNWVNESPSVMTPKRMVELTQQMAQDKALTCHVLTKEDCEKHGMGLILAVAKGSILEPYLVHLTYKPTQLAPEKQSKKVYALIGKGVTFDSGGLAIKTLDGMIDMKTDMAGATTVIATMGLLADMGCPHEVHAFTPLVENMISDRSFRPGDIYRAMNGTSVEITNPDAEGRLILSDAICYAKQTVNPDEIVDLATLTGASIIALGATTAAVISNTSERADAFLAAAHTSGEDMWPLPLNERLREGLNSYAADIRNSGPRPGNTITAATFIKEFVGETPWIHVDMAGPAFVDKEYAHHTRGATGFGVTTLVEYLAPHTT